MMHIDDRNSLLSSERKSADMFSVPKALFIGSQKKSDNKILSISNYNFISFWRFTTIDVGAKDFALKYNCIL